MTEETDQQVLLPLLLNYLSCVISKYLTFQTADDERHLMEYLSIDETFPKSHYTFCSRK